MLEGYIRKQREQKDILLMTHIVMGYPSFEASLQVVDAMVEAGVELMELQIPFSEPIADGPVILRANQEALARGSTVAKCWAFAEQVCARHDIPFLFMSYFNLLYRPGVERFVKRMQQTGLRGAIVPDLPPEEAQPYLAAMRESALDPIFIYSPNTREERLARIAQDASGFVYCVARKGVTGSATTFDADLDGYLERCRAATKLPLALGFGVKDAADVDYLRGKVDVAVVGSETLRVIDRDGVDAVGPFIRSLRGG